MGDYSKIMYHLMKGTQIIDVPDSKYEAKQGTEAMEVHDA